MKKASELLELFKNKIHSHKHTQTLLSDSLEGCLNVKVSPESFLIKNNTVFVKCDSVIKNEIVLKKDNIIDLFHQKGGSTDIINIY